MPPRPPSLFTDAPSPSGTITAHCDGGARGNPGPAGFGAQITDSNGGLVAELSEFLGIRTNNYAEYAGLLASLQYALDHNHRSLRVISDSELMVKQIQGKYKVNSPDLKPLWQEARNRIAKLERFEITHALRHKNKDADRLANEAMDRGMKLGGRTPEGRPVTTAAGVQSLPLRALPYPSKSTAPAPPASFDPRQPLSPSKPAAQPELPKSEAKGRSPHLVSRPATPEPPPAMLRGFARDGVIHILGAHNLPNGTFVKIIPE